jgi:protein-disulfide isomerase
MMAFASTLRPIAAIAGALALLAACGESQQTAADGFKPVPVTPLLTDLPLGDPNATVTVIEYASLACSHCRDFWKQDFPRLKANYIDTGKIKYIYRDYPIDADLSILLASVARCGGPDKYYAMLDDLFAAQYDILTAAQTGAAGPIIAGVGEKHGVTRDQARTCIDHTPALKEAILKSAEEGGTRGVRSTPTVFVNDERATDHTYDPLSKLIDQKLNPGITPETPATPTTPTEGAPASAAGQ